MLLVGWLLVVVALVTCVQWRGRYTEHTACGLYGAVVTVVTVQTSCSQQRALKDEKVDSAVRTNNSM